MYYGKVKVCNYVLWKSENYLFIFVEDIPEGEYGKEEWALHK